jgi:tetratricopeptide (TPR) repeat protein
MMALNPAEALEEAVSHHQAGRLAEAERFYRQVLSGKPNHPDALHLLGMIAIQTGRLDMAIELLRRAVATNPGIAEFQNSLGNALNDKGLFDEAIAAFRQAIRIKPAYAEAHNNLGISLRAKGLLDEAIAAYRQAIRVEPGYAKAHNNLGNALRNKGLLDEAAAAYRQALRLTPAFAEAHRNLGNALYDMGQIDECINAYHRALQLKPDLVEARNSLGTALRRKGLLDEAIAAYHDAFRMNPEYVGAHENLAHVLLLKGDFVQGWSEYEWRWKREAIASQRHKFVQPRWDGQDLNGRRILLYSEQGLGDTIQFVRYAPMVSARGGKVVLECQAELRGLMRGVVGIEQMVSVGEPLPDFDVHCPLMSLPLAFNTRMETIPAAIPYLHADEKLSRQWAARLAEPDRPKVGIAWAGSAQHINDRNRSLSLSLLGPLAKVGDIRFYSLQKGAGAAEASTPPEGMKLIDHTAELTDFADTAALMANLDLVISADTAVVHLAGALGKPVWVLLPCAPDWRWLLEREDSPWYPTIRLFRQRTPGKWSEVVDRVAQALCTFDKRETRE